MNSITKCRYYNQGYCKKKSECTYIHPSEDCEDDCSDSKCPFRHRKLCINGENCYYNRQDVCEYRHDNVIQIIKRKIKDENRHFRSKVEELTKIISNKENKMLEIKSNYNQLFDQNKIAFEKIEKLEKRLNDKEMEKIMKMKKCQTIMN
jgi:hypothetical protein